jgi:hypothetical protein
VVDIVLSSDELTVLGGPASINVSVDLGPQGTRGSYIFTGDGKPTDQAVEFNASKQVNDLYINLKPSDNEYLFLYQRVLVNGVETWQKVLRLVPNTAFYNPPVTFVNGQAVTEIATGVYVPDALFPLASFFSLEDLGEFTYLDFNIQYSLLADNPVSSSINVSEITSTVTYAGAEIPLGSPHLPISCSAVEYVDGAWQPLNGQYLIHLLITVGGAAA